MVNLLDCCSPSTRTAILEIDTSAPHARLGGVSAVWRPLAVAAVSAILGIVAVVRLAGDDDTTAARPAANITGALGAVRIGQPAAEIAGDPLTAPPLVDTLRQTRRPSRRVRCADGEVRFDVGYAPALGADSPEDALRLFEGMPLAAQLSETFFKEIFRRGRLVRYRILDRDGRPIGVARVGLGTETEWHVLALRTCAA
jgi:hypothetical protein